MTTLLMIIWLVILWVSFLIQMMLKRKFAHYVNMPAPMSWREVSEFLLRYNNIDNVTIGKWEWMLTDYYDSSRKHINLSPDVYETRSVAAMAVAAHETGHAIQDHQRYAPLVIRNMSVPIVSIAWNIVPFIMWGWMLFGMSPDNWLWNSLLLIWIIAYAVIAGFSLITLPVEYDASARAVANLKSSGIINEFWAEKKWVIDLLFWAGMTYVLNALSSVVELLKLLSIFGSRKNEE